MRHIVCFLLFKTGETYLFYADAQQDSELMHATIQFVTVSLILMFYQASAFNSIKSLISNNSPLLSGGYNDAFVHSSNKKCLLDIFSASTVCRQSLQSCLTQGGNKGKSGVWCNFSVILFDYSVKVKKKNTTLDWIFCQSKKQKALKVRFNFNQLHVNSVLYLFLQPQMFLMSFYLNVGNIFICMNA